MPTPRGPIGLDYVNGTLKASVPAGLRATVEFAGETRELVAGGTAEISAK